VKTAQAKLLACLDPFSPIKPALSRFFVFYNPAIARGSCVHSARRKTVCVLRSRIHPCRKSLRDQLKLSKNAPGVFVFLRPPAFCRAKGVKTAQAKLLACLDPFSPIKPALSRFFVFYNPAIARGLCVHSARRKTVCVLRSRIHPCRKSLRDQLKLSKNAPGVLVFFASTGLLQSKKRENGASQIVGLLGSVFTH